MPECPSRDELRGYGLQLAREKGIPEQLCSPCFKPGTMTHADGRATQHPAMALDEQGR